LLPGELLGDFVKRCELVGMPRDQIEELATSSQYHFAEEKSLTATIQTDFHYFRVAQSLRLARRSLALSGLKIFSALEALAAGAPLIVADTGGLAELIDGTGAGLTFEPGSPDALAATIVKVLDDGRLARDLVARAYDLVDERYTWSAIARRTSEVYQSAIDGR
jgi:glycosyltransferase involved in cell wall biosynthesis